MPKRLTILALGSRGDVQPYLALGKGLKAAGYLVRIVTFESFREFIEGHGLDFYPVPGDAQDLLAAASRTNALRTQNPLAAMHAIMATYGRLVEGYMSAFSSERLFDSDAILNQLPGSLFGVDLAEKLRVPHLVVSVIPLTATGAFPNPLLSTRSFGSVMNRFTYVGAAQLLWAFFRPHIAKFREKLGLNAPSLLLHPSCGPILNGFSPLVISPPHDWAASVYTTGYWILDETEWRPPVSLAEFLDGGEPPVFFGFGSMIAPNPTQLTKTILDAIQQSGRRAILSSGWADLGSGSLPTSVFRLSYRYVSRV